MIDLKPYGAFIEYTIRPLIEEIRRLFKEIGVNLNEDKLNAVLVNASRLHLQHMALNFLTQLIVTAMLCGTAIYIFRCTTSL